MEATIGLCPGQSGEATKGVGWGGEQTLTGLGNQAAMQSVSLSLVFSLPPTLRKVTKQKGLCIVNIW